MNLKIKLTMVSILLVSIFLFSMLQNVHSDLDDIADKCSNCADEECALKYCLPTGEPMRNWMTIVLGSIYVGFIFMSLVWGFS